MLNLSRRDPNGHKMLNGHAPDGIGTDLVSSIQTRRSMQARRSLDHRLSVGSNGFRNSDRDGLMRSYDEEENAGFGLTDLAEESEEDTPIHVNGTANGNSKRSFSGISDRERPPRSPAR